MKIFIKILLLSFLLIPARFSFGQSSVSKSDSTHVVRKNDKSVNDSRQRKMDQDKNSKLNQDSNSGTDKNPASGMGPDNRGNLKRINSARPDMTRIRNARPPDIMRPAGGLMPRGIGRPGGAFRPGGH
jgi:hypothetical protein